MEKTNLIETYDLSKSNGKMDIVKLIIINVNLLIAIQEEYNPETYRDGIQDALDVMHAELNRTLVQVVLMFDISPLENVSTGVSCDAVHR